jgi:hypothetical protein
MRNLRHGSDATVAWMTADIALRCREAVQRLDAAHESASQLGDAAILLRGAADDLISLVELVEGPAAADRIRADDSSDFDVAFRHARTPFPSGSGL